jgi:anaerobic magnesium-protoporphyrin IX monomethyl ester cyclase
LVVNPVLTLGSKGDVKTMKILLIYPYFIENRVHEEEIAAVPMGLYYIGAMLKSHGHHVEILNWHAAGDSQDTIKETLISRKPDIIGFSIVHANRWGAIEIARLAKALDPDLPVVFGGIGATFLWKHLLTHFRQIDYIVLGEGEFTFLRLAETLDGGATSDQVASIPGLALRTPEGIVQTPSAPPIQDLDALPPPARYFDFQHISLTRGCPGRCTFCGSPRFWGRRIRSHSADYFVDQLATLAGRGIRFFYVSDDTFTLNSALVIEVCRKIIARELKITWQAIAKVSAVDAEMLYWMRKAGCVQISYGVESGSPRIRRLFCKDIHADQIARAFSLTVAHGILARAYFIYGAPGENDATIQETLDLIRRIKPLSAIFYILDLFPGTALYDAFKQRTGASDDIWLERREDILYFETDPELNQDQVLHFGRQLRGAYHQWLPDMARDIALKNDPDLKAEQADFLSRLAMTFSHGDYARIQCRAAPLDTARILYRQALDRGPDHRAFWGLGLTYQMQGDPEAAVRTLQQGLIHFPHSRELHITLGIAYAAQNRCEQALAHLLPYENAPEALPHIARCRQALAGNSQGAE